MIRARWAFLLAFLLAGSALLRDGFDAWIDATRLPPLTPESSVEVVDRDGQLLRAFTVADGRWRLPISVDQTDPQFLALLLAYEDRRFYRHAGVDPLAVARAAWQALAAGHAVSGGSTLTMQTARLLEGSGTGHWAGKIRQMRVALALERRLSKAEILTLYLQLAPYGGNIEGLRAASLAYLGKEPRRLTPAEAALLVALPQSPESRRPDRHPDRAALARDRVLDRARQAGLLSKDDVAAARREPLPIQRRAVPALAAHLADRARADPPGLQRHALTIDRHLQLAFEALAADSVAALGDDVQIALVAADHQTGEILASVGSAGLVADRRLGFIDMTQALRSPGSTLKPLVYALAFDDGLIHPESWIEDRPIRFGSYAPQNFDRQFHGTVRVRDALQMSLNIPVVELTHALGPARLLSALDQAGVRHASGGRDAGLAIALGGIGVNLQDMVQLYAALARGGTALPLHWRQDGPPPPDPVQLVSEVAAWQVGDILAGLPPPPGAPSNRLAYKTGTSYGHRDTWAIGYDGRHVVGVWIGRADGTPMPGALGADRAAPVLFQAFARLKPQLDPQPVPPPSTLLVANAQLPPPLQQFRPRDAAFALTADAPKLVFPPDGAVLSPLPGGLKVRVEGGTAPFGWLVDGAPARMAEPRREALLPLSGEGFVTLAVIDALGRSARSTIRLQRGP